MQKKGNNSTDLIEQKLPGFLIEIPGHNKVMLHCEDNGNRTWRVDAFNPETNEKETIHKDINGGMLAKMIFKIFDIKTENKYY